MPAGFLWCMKQKGHRVRTIKSKSGVYIHICWHKGKSYRGEVHHIEKKSFEEGTIERIKKYISHSTGQKGVRKW